MGSYETITGWEGGLKEQNCCIYTFVLKLVQMELNEGRKAGKLFFYSLS